MAGGALLSACVGTPRVSWLAEGLFWDGWLAHAGVIQVWPRALPGHDRTLELQLSLPGNAKPVQLDLRAPGKHLQLTMRAGECRVVSFAIRGDAPWTLHYYTPHAAFLSDLRAVSVRSGEYLRLDFSKSPL